jgi:putative Mg2+ transporter-C (MgtC) family protein
MVLRPLAYRIHPALPDATPVETLNEIPLTCGISVAAHIRSLLLTTISRLPMLLQSIHGEQDEQTDETRIRAEMMTAGRNNEALEQVVVRLSIEDEVSNLSWSIVQSSME